MTRHEPWNDLLSSRKTSLDVYEPTVHMCFSYPLIGLLYRFEDAETFGDSSQIGFYPRDAMLARVIEIATCLSVRLSVRHAPVLCQNEES